MKSVLIGMSGGVDSSVAAALLKEQGYRVIGCTMRLWSNAIEEDARKVCEHLEIDFRILDFKELFKEKVITYFIDSYKNGETPNPCIMCNKHLKFGAMFEYAKAEGIDYIATGHYAKIGKTKDGKYTLNVSDADNKDQSYFLYNFNQEILSRTLMPLGDYNKAQVREIADRLNLPVANKPESQEICFVEDNNYARFICEFASYTPQKGDILDINGNVIGEHMGLIYYTIGQRKGIGAYGRPMFIKDINPVDNTITLGEKGMEFSKSLVAKNLNFISGEIPKEPVKVQVKIRYQARKADALLIPLDKTHIKLEFDEPQRAVTPGQAAVFYDGNSVLGGGTVVIA